MKSLMVPTAMAAIMATATALAARDKATRLCRCVTAHSSVLSRGEPLDGHDLLVIRFEANTKQSWMFHPPGAGTWMRRRRRRSVRAASAERSAEGGATGPRRAHLPRERTYIRSGACSDAIAFCRLSLWRSFCASDSSWRFSIRIWR